jgi:hypothetical protein
VGEAVVLLRLEALVAIQFFLRLLLLVVAAAVPVATD